MKKIIFFVIFAVGTAISRGQDSTVPGWSTPSGTPPAMTPINTNLGSLTTPPSIPGGSNAIAEVVTPEISALARALQNDPTQIYNYVHDHIQYVHYFGSKKGAELTLLEGSGNDMDQCALLVALLTAAGQTANYQFGIMYVPYTNSMNQDYMHWIGTTEVNTNWTNLLALIGTEQFERGFPYLNYFIGDSNDLIFHHTWVTLSLGGTNYLLDPSFKISTPVSGINLSNAMGLDTNALMTVAGGTSTSNYVQYLNEGNLRNALLSYTTNFLGYLQSNYPNASVAQIMGGGQIVSSVGQPLGASSPCILYTNGTAWPISTWQYIPTNLMSTLTYELPGTNQMFFMPDLRGDRLSLTFDSGGMARLWRQDTNIYSVQTSGGSTINVALFVHHPFGTWVPGNNTFTNMTNGDRLDSNVAYQRTSATYALLYSFDPSVNELQHRQNQLELYQELGFATNSEQVLGETLNVMGLSWMLEDNLVSGIGASQMNMNTMAHHRIGRMAQVNGAGYFVDVYEQLDGTFSNSGITAADTNRLFTFINAMEFFSSALEYGVIEQLQSSNLGAVSTVKLLEIASTNSEPIYLANSANWSAVSGSLSGYDTTSLYNNFIVSNYTLLLPQSADQTLGDWTGYGIAGFQEVSNPWHISMLISGGYSGGFASYYDAFVNTPFELISQAFQPYYYFADSPFAPASTAADPVDMASGTFQISSTDMSEGTTEPRGLSFSRFYSSALRNHNPAGMAYGWTHNYCFSLAQISGFQASLGQTTPQQMAPMIVATCAALNLYNPQPDPKNWMVTALISKWGVDQLTSNAVSVAMGQDTIQFIKQPDGSFTPPADCTLTLSTTNGAFNLQERHGRTFRFGSSGLLTNIVDQYTNVHLTLNYTNNLVSSVTDWKGRELIFTYSNSPPQLVEVSDNTGRTLFFGYSSNYNAMGDLVSATDPEHAISSYGYDTNHQVIATSNALNQLVVTNVFDAFGRVMTQYTEGATNKTWQVYASGFQTVVVDPLGGQQTYFYDGQSRQIGFEDALGNLTQTIYDGQDHVVMTISPLSETNQFIYDSQNNLIASVDPLGFTNMYVYDTQNNLVQTVDKNGHTNSFGYNSHFQLTVSTNGAGDAFTNTYSSTDGSLSTRADSAGNITYTYDTYGQLNTIIFPNGLGTNGYLNNSYGDVLSFTNGLRNVTSYLYNLRRQLTNTIAPTNLITQTSYDAVGNVATNIDALSNKTINTWSPTRKLLTTTLPATAAGTAIITNTYDSRDWLTTVIKPLQETNRYSNDFAGRSIAIIDPLNRTSSFGYDDDGRRTSLTNGANQTTTQQWNGRGDLLQVTDPATNIIQPAYDPAGNQITVTNRDGKKWQFQFDGVNRLTATITPSLRTNQQIWNHQGLIASNIQPSGATTTFLYDARNQLTNRTDGVGTTVFYRDFNGNITNVTENGLSISSVYDAYDRLISYTDANGYNIQYRYDANGNVTNLIYPGGRTVTNTYDAFNHLTKVTDWANRQTVFTYDLNGRLTNITRPNGTVRLINYDAADQATNITEEAASSAPIAFIRRSFDNAGRTQWEFDGPLPQSNAPPSRTMTVDSDNRLATFNGTNVTNDLNGNMTGAPLTNSTFATYAYDARNRLESVGGLSYSYDPAGNRIAVTNAGNVSQFVFNPNAKLPRILMRIRSGVTNFYVYGNGLLYEVTETATTTNTATYHYDSRGSTVALTDTNGNVTDHVEYSAYGIMTYRLGTNDTPFLYNGRYGVQSDANGLLYMRARYYNPYLCRFMNADPSGFSGGLNWYAYADGNPISEIDPFGLGAIGDEGWGGTTATWLDKNIVGRLSSVSTGDGMIDGPFFVVTSLVQGVSDMLRLGQGTANAVYNAQDGWDVAIGIVQDIERASGIAVLAGGGLKMLAGDTTIPVTDDTPASTPTGQSGAPMNVSTANNVPSNPPATINGVNYSGHALDSMQSDGITPSVVENTIKQGQSIPGKVPGTTAFYDPVNNVTVIQNSSTGRIVTASSGRIKQ